MHNIQKKANVGKRKANCLKKRLRGSQKQPPKTARWEHAVIKNTD